MNFADNAYLFIDLDQAYLPTPRIPPGAIDLPVDFGSRTMPGIMGAGRTTEYVHRTPVVGRPTTLAEAPYPAVFSGSIRVCNDSSTLGLEISFDGVNVHGRLQPDEQVIYEHRHESGIALRGVGGPTGAFRVEAW